MGVSLEFLNFFNLIAAALYRDWFSGIKHPKNHTQKRWQLIFYSFTYRSAVYRSDQLQRQCGTFTTADAQRRPGRA